MRNPQTILGPDLAGFGDSLTGDHAEQRRLPGSVSTDETNPLSGLNLKLDLSEQWQIAIGQRNIF
jgi:hypothetical protein